MTCDVAFVTQQSVTLAHVLRAHEQRQVQAAPCTFMHKTPEFTYTFSVLNFIESLVQNALLSTPAPGGKSSSSSSSSNSNSSLPISVVLHLGHSGGIGNKLVAAASALLIALLSNRCDTCHTPSHKGHMSHRAAVSLLPHDTCDSLDLPVIAPYIAVACSAPQAAQWLQVREQSISEEGAAEHGWPLMFAGFLNPQYSALHPAPNIITSFML